MRSHQSTSFAQLLAVLHEDAIYRQLDRGEVLFQQGESTLALFEVVTGRVKLVRYLADGTEVCLHSARAGESFAEAALFSVSYHCDAVAELPSEVTAYSKPAILHLLHSQPDTALQFIALFTERIQALRTLLEIQNIHSARDRTLQYLFLLAESEGIVWFDRPLKDVATTIGLSHEAFYRALAQLEQDGYIQRNRRQIRLLYPKI